MPRDGRKHTSYARSRFSPEDDVLIAFFSYRPYYDQVGPNGDIVKSSIK